MTPKRRVDLSESSLKKLIRCEKILDDISLNYTPESCLKMLKVVCEERNRALQGHEKVRAKYHIGDTYYERDARQDIALFMRTIKRKLGGQLSAEYSECEMYFRQQKMYFKQLRAIKKHRSSAESRTPGKTSFNQPGVYNGLPWVLLCLDAALNFNDTTSASTLYSYFW